MPQWIPKRPAKASEDKPETIRLSCCLVAGMREPVELALHRVEEDQTALPGRENKRTRGTMLKPDGLVLIHTLEDQVRLDDPLTPDNEGAKVYGRTAIPAGSYALKLTYSPKYGRIRPEVMNVPGFVGIRIHSGHDELHTLGCILTAGGFDRDGDILPGSSKPAEKAFEDYVVPLLEAGTPVFLTITNDFLEA